MRETESFDAFYARTVSDVTRQMHELAGGDPQADHAIREAYARAYQQWFEVSGYRDPASWVLDIAKEALERRRSQPMSDAVGAQPADSGTWPGMYRPVAPSPRSAADPEGTLTSDASARLGGTARPGSWQPGPAPGGQALADPYQPGTFAASQSQGQRYEPSPFGPALADPYQPALGASPSSGDAIQPTALASPGTPGAPPPTAGMPGHSASARTTGGGRVLSGQPGLGKPIIAVLAVIALLVAASVYLAFGRGHSSPSAGRRTGAKSAVTKPQVHMLPAGQAGTRADVPWSLVGPGWTLAELSSAPPGSSGQVTGGGSSTTFLVDPKGGRYQILQWPSGTNPTLLAWSGNKKEALFAVSGGYQMLTVKSGQVARFALPAGVSAAGFTRPDGLNILAVRQARALNKLQRYNLAGAYQATLSSMARRPVQGTLAGSCASSDCGALSSPDGVLAVWGLRGDEMQLVQNGGGIVRRLHVPDSGKPPSCTPVSWWNKDTILADCTAVSSQVTQLRLWLVPADGSPPSPLTATSGGPAGSGYFTGAWPSGGQVYATATSSAQCQGAAGGAAGLSILHLSQAGTSTPVTIPGDTYSTIVGNSGGGLQVLTQPSCQGTSSLLWLNPSTGATRVLLTAAGKAGVTAAVPFG